MALIQIAFEIISTYKPLEIPIKSELKKISNIKKSVRNYGVGNFGID